MNRSASSASSCLVPLALVSIASLTHCVEHPRARGRNPAPGAADAEVASPMHIGYGDDVPQVHFPLVTRAPTRAVGVVHVAAPATVVSLPEGGALLAWGAPRPSAANATNLYVRRYDAVGHGEATFLMHGVRGTVRAIAGAARADDALFVWNAAFGAGTSQVSAQRLRHDVTQLNAIFNLGLFRIAPPAVDGGAATDALGFYALAAPVGARYIASLRGPLLDCPEGLCASARVVEINDENEIIGRGGVSDPHPALPVVLTGSATEAWSLALTTRSGSPLARVATFGTGALSHLHPPEGQSLEAAWVDAQGSAHAIVRHDDTLSWVDAGDTPTLTPVLGARLACANHVAAVAVQRRDGVQSVPVTLPGAGSLVAWAVGHAGATPVGTHRPTTVWPEAGFAGIHAAGLTGAGWLSVSPAGVGFSSCQGDVLTTPAIQPEAEGAGDGGA